MDIRLSATTVECFHAGERVARHPRDPEVRWHTRPEPRPPHHRTVQQGWDPAVFRRQAAAIGPHAHQLIDTILARAVVPQQVFRQCQGLWALAPRDPPEGLETAAQRAVQAEAWRDGAVHAFCVRLTADRHRLRGGRPMPMAGGPSPAARGLRTLPHYRPRAPGPEQGALMA